MARNEKTRPRAAKTSAKLLRTSKSKDVRRVAGSDLTQAPDRKRRKR